MRNYSVCIYVSGNLCRIIFLKRLFCQKKPGIVNSSFTTKFCTSKLWGPQPKKQVLYTNLQKILRRGFSAVHFVNKILSCVTLVYNSLRKPAVWQKLWDIRFSNKHCIFFTRLPTRQDGFQNYDKVCIVQEYKLYNYILSCLVAIPFWNIRIIDVHVKISRVAW